MANDSQQSQQDMPEMAREAPSQFRSACGGFLLPAVAFAAFLAGVYSAGLLWQDRGETTGGGASQPDRVPALRKSSTVPADLDSQSRAPQTARDLIGEATQVVERLTESFVDDTDCLELKARLENWLGKSEQAAKTWEKCLELDPRYAHAYVGMAGVAAKLGDHREAERLARKAIEIAPESFQARFVLAESLLNLGQPEEVVPVLADFLQRDPRSYGYFLLGRAYAQTRQYEKAKESYQSAVQKHAEYAEAYYALSRVCARLGLSGDASRSMARYRELTAQRQATRQGMGTASDLDSVRRSVATMITDTGRVYYAREKRREAERLWRRAAAVHPENVECRHALVVLYGVEGKVLNTIDVLEELARIDQQNPTYKLEIGRLRAKLLQFDLAEDALREACRAAPQYAPSRAALASYLLQTNRKLSDALSLARTAAKQEPTADNHALLAVACQANGDRPGALAAIEQAIAQSPENPAYRQLQESLKAAAK